jgi:hypothetical protein
MAVRPVAEVAPEVQVEQAPKPSPIALASPPQVQLKNPSASVSVSINVGGKLLTVPTSESNREMPAASKLRQFQVEDGVAVIDGDVVLGVPDHSTQTGVAEIPTMQLWSTREIPYFIQPGVVQPARILEAIRMFSGTAIVLVPFTDQEDAIVFVPGTGDCKSYVGQKGGKQPIWIAPACGPKEVAHEIMHALGFTHEQNRFDRDKYIKLNRENIDPAKIVNFEKMPEEFMQITGQSEFSFTSIMIYPPKLFSLNGQATMEPLDSREQIAPSQALNDEDVARINKVYGPL